MKNFTLKCFTTHFIFYHVSNKGTKGCLFDTENINKHDDEQYNLVLLLEKRLISITQSIFNNCYQVDMGDKQY